MKNRKKNNPNASSSQAEPSRPLYDRYKDFMTRLANGRDRPVKMHTWEDFCRWWKDLDPGTQERCRADFQKGYDQVVKEAGERVSQAMQKYTVRPPNEPKQAAG